MWFQQHVTIAFYLNVLNIFIRTEQKKVRRQSSLLSQKLSSFIGYKANTTLHGCPGVQIYDALFVDFLLADLATTMFTQVFSSWQKSACDLSEYSNHLFFFFLTDERCHQRCQLKSGRSFSQQLLLLLKAISATETGNLLYLNNNQTWPSCQ